MCDRKPGVYQLIRREMAPGETGELKIPSWGFHPLSGEITRYQMRLFTPGPSAKRHLAGSSRWALRHASVSVGSRDHPPIALAIIGVGTNKRSPA